VLLQDGKTCWRTARAHRGALLIDMARYFEAAKAAMQRARHSIHFLNWAFEQGTFLNPGPNCTGDEGDRIGNFLKDLADANHDLDVRILCWNSAMPVAATQRFFPFADRAAFKGTRVKFVLDAKLPVGASHHQKMVVIDDAVAFCGGGDIGPDRWDTTAHADDDPRRERTRRDHKDFDSRHEVMGVVDGDAAVMLADLFRARWLRATGEVVTPCPRVPAPWPDSVTPDFQDIVIGAARTQGAWRAYPSVREVEALHVASIAAAQRVIYMENQYFTSPLIAEALAARLREADGPEVVLVSTQHSPSYFDQATMDKTRLDFIAHLTAADAHGRLRAYSPVTTLGRTIIVHAKLTIIDDRLLRIGSANINNRSMGFDTECDLCIEAEAGSANGARIGVLRTQLLAHWLGCGSDVVTDAVRAAGSLTGGLEALRMGGYTRLRPIGRGEMTAVSAVVSKYHLGDPVSASDSWRPWARREALRHVLAGYGLEPAQAKLVPER
jgi:phosphatidylserine/phosphatidylglycerophosphate/cardiolipin synthase-like enzyme